MKVGQAAFGAKNKGHSLLGASPLAIAASTIVNQMDVQGTAPPGVVWPPYLSGFASGDNYVLARTAPDAKAERAGMVRSRALFFPLDAIRLVQSLGQAATFLREAFDNPPPYKDVEIETVGNGGSPHRGLLSALIRANGTTVVWPGDDEFEDALESLCTICGPR